MEKKDYNLTNSEWNVMECLWEDSPRSGREAIEAMKESMGWNRSTTLTMLRRLEEKGAIYTQTLDELKMFYPAISREQAAIQETDSFLEKVYQGSLSMMLSTFTRKQNLSKQEIDELYQILNELEEKTNE
ncbi:MAG: BlaI/MecI/CopY family transcriptional regulator [Lachnospiraceae bacterium]